MFQSAEQFIGPKWLLMGGEGAVGLALTAAALLALAALRPAGASGGAWRLLDDPAHDCACLGATGSVAALAAAYVAASFAFNACLLRRGCGS